MWCPSRFSAWSSTVYLVHHPAQYSYFVTFLEPPPLCRRHTTFLLFLSIDFWLQITQLQHSLRKISSWMIANLSTLNSSKTEFLLVGLPQQLAKISTSSLRPISLSSQPSFLANVNSCSCSLYVVVRPSVCLSVCNVRAPYSGDWNFWQYFYMIRKNIYPSFLRSCMVGGDDPFYVKFWVNRPPLERNRHFRTWVRVGLGLG